jgi:hypothetical protein
MNNIESLRLDFPNRTGSSKILWFFGGMFFGSFMPTTTVLLFIFLQLVIQDEPINTGSSNINVKPRQLIIWAYEACQLLIIESISSLRDRYTLHKVNYNRKK